MENENQAEKLPTVEETAPVADSAFIHDQVADQMIPAINPAPLSPEPSVLSPVLTESINPRIPTDNDAQIF